MRTVAIVSPGAMGSAVGSLLAGAGTRVVATVDGRSGRTAALAEQAGLELLPDLDAVVADAAVVLSIVPPAEAAHVAADVARAGERAGVRPLLVELNATAPETVRTIAAREGDALDVVDGSISGPPPRAPGTTTIYLSGARVVDVVALGFPGVELVVVGSELGLASAVKMCTASVYKGTLALFAHALLTAAEHGVAAHVLDDLRDSFPGYVSQPGGLLARAASVSSRYVGEMREIAATQAAAGLPATLFESMADVFEQLSARPLARTAPEDVDRALPLEDALAGLE